MSVITNWYPSLILMKKSEITGTPVPVSVFAPAGGAIFQLGLL